MSEFTKNFINGKFYIKDDYTYRSSSKYATQPYVTDEYIIDILEKSSLEKYKYLAKILKDNGLTYVEAYEKFTELRRDLPPTAFQTYDQYIKS